MKRQQQQAQGIKTPSEKNLLSAHPSSRPMTSASESEARWVETLVKSPVANIKGVAGHNQQK